jgi:predicted CopG family antitoxin
MSQRKITILDEAGYEEVVKYKWDEDGSEGFSETLANFQATVPRDLLTITP